MPSIGAHRANTAPVSSPSSALSGSTTASTGPTASASATTSFNAVETSSGEGQPVTWAQWAATARMMRDGAVALGRAGRRVGESLERLEEGLDNLGAPPDPKASRTRNTGASGTARKQG
ncbi:MAG: hypothetical protein IPK13_09640 [Deltaproteobacteria bacterium]|nr:hypothetical protein [Deltaproteobacteria bacterium]